MSYRKAVVRREGDGGGPHYLPGSSSRRPAYKDKDEDRHPDGDRRPAYQPLRPSSRERREERHQRPERGHERRRYDEAKPQHVVLPPALQKTPGYWQDQKQRLEEEKRKLQREKEELEHEKAVLEQELAAQAWQQERQEQRRREQERERRRQEEERQEQRRRQQEQREYEAREAARREKADRVRRAAELGRRRPDERGARSPLRIAPPKTAPNDAPRRRSREPDDAQRRRWRGEDRQPEAERRGPWNGHRPSRVGEPERRVERRRGSRDREDPRGWQGEPGPRREVHRGPPREGYAAGDRHRPGAAPYGRAVANDAADRLRQRDFSRSGKGKGKGAGPRRFDPEETSAERGARRGAAPWQPPSDVGRAPPEKPCKELVKRMAMCLKNKVKAVVEADGTTSGPQISLEALREKMNLCLPTAELQEMLDGPLNEELVVQAGGFLYCHLDSEKRTREAEAAAGEEPPEKRPRVEEETDGEDPGDDPMHGAADEAQEPEHEHDPEPEAEHEPQPERQTSAERQAEEEREKREELLRKDLRDKQARMEALARQLEQRRAEEEELARLQREVEALRGHLGEEEGGAEAEGEAEGPGHGHGEDPEAAEFPAED